jgi:hypothetical protein
MHNTFRSRGRPPGRPRTPTPAAVYTIAEFCEAHRMSQTQYHRLQKRNPPEGPREMRVGTRVYISNEAAAAWRRVREEIGQQAHEELSRQIGLDRD